MTPASSPPPRAHWFALLWLALTTLLGMSTWFSGTAVLGPLREAWQLSPTQGAWLTIAVQLGFVAGALLSMVYEISPSMGEPYTVTALIVITLGGLGSAGGCLAGGMLLGLVEAFGMHFTSPSLKMLLSYGVFILVLLARPRGLFAR